MSIQRKKALIIATTLILFFGAAVYLGLLIKSNEAYDYAKEEQITSVSLSRLNLKKTIEILYKGRPVFIHLPENGKPIVLDGVSKIPGSSVHYVVRYIPGKLGSGEEYSYHSNGHGTYYKSNGQAIQLYENIEIESLPEIEYEIRENQVVLVW